MDITRDAVFNLLKLVDNYKILLATSRNVHKHADRSYVHKHVWNSPCHSHGSENEKLKQHLRYGIADLVPMITFCHELNMRFTLGLSMKVENESKLFALVEAMLMSLLNPDEYPLSKQKERGAETFVKMALRTILGHIQRCQQIDADIGSMVDYVERITPRDDSFPEIDEKELWKVEEGNAKIIEPRETDLRTWTPISKEVLRMYSATLCLQVAQFTQGRNLPREVRDLICSQLIKSLCSERRALKLSYLHPQNFFHFDDHFGNDGDLQLNSWAMDPAHVGKDMADEIAQVYYRERSFWVDSPDHLPALVSSDPLHHSLRSANHIRDIIINTDPYCYKKDELHTNLMTLCSLTRREVLRVEIRLQTFYQVWRDGADIEMVNLLEHLRWPVYELLHAGSEVIVSQFDSDMDEHFPCVRERYLTRHSKSHRADFFQLSAQEWTQEKANTPDCNPFTFQLSRDAPQSEVNTALGERWGQDNALGGFHYPEDDWDDDYNFDLGNGAENEDDGDDGSYESFDYEGADEDYEGDGYYEEL